MTKYMLNFALEFEVVDGSLSQADVFHAVYKALGPFSRNGNLTMTSWRVSEVREELTEEPASDACLTCASCSADAHEED